MSNSIGIFRFRQATIELIITYSFGVTVEELENPINNFRKECINQ